MQRLFESIYRECLFFNTKPIEVGQSIADNWKKGYNQKWAKGLIWINTADYDDTDHSINFDFRIPSMVAEVPGNIIQDLIDEFPKGDHRPFASQVPINDSFSIDKNKVKVVLLMYK